MLLRAIIYDFIHPIQVDLRDGHVEHQAFSFRKIVIKILDGSHDLRKEE
jgi:hypothetical protein